RNEPANDEAQPILALAIDEWCKQILDAFISDFRLRQAFGLLGANEFDRWPRAEPNLMRGDLDGLPIRIAKIDIECFVSRGSAQESEIAWSIEQRSGFKHLDCRLHRGFDRCIAGRSEIAADQPLLEVP